MRVYIYSRRQAAENNTLGQLGEGQSALGLLQQECMKSEECGTFSGRRIVNIVDFFEQVKDLDKHSPFGCTFSNMKVISEKRLGLKSGFVFQCQMCNFKTTVCSEKKTRQFDGCKHRCCLWDYYHRRRPRSVRRVFECTRYSIDVSENI